MFPNYIKFVYLRIMRLYYCEKGGSGVRMHEDQIQQDLVEEMPKNKLTRKTVEKAF